MSGTNSWWSPAGLSGLGVAALCGLTVLLLASARWRNRPGVAVAAGALTFQLVHFLEHGFQLVYWVVHPKEAPWLTPWAAVARDGLGYWCQILPGAGSSVIRGNEVLHLLGNIVFLLGIAAMRHAMAHKGVRLRVARDAFLVQSVHVAEHVMLTASLFATGKAMGISTAFGVLDPTQSRPIAFRVVFHFGINLVATTLTAIALVQARERTKGDVSPASVLTAEPELV